VLHDVGKIARGFQVMLRDGPRFRDRHEVLSLVAVGWLDLPDSPCALVAAGVATHHKDIDEILDHRYPFHAPEELERLLSEIDVDDEGRLRHWLCGDGIPSLERLGFAGLPPLNQSGKVEAVARALRLIDGLRQSLQRSEATTSEAKAARFVRGLVMLADHAASAHVHFGKAPTLDTPVALMTEIRRALGAAGTPVALWPHQELAAESKGHAVLRAPTGSGKTEAALLWAARQRHDGPGHPPVFYVLPYRASLNAMRHRIPERYGVPETSVVLQHSSATAALYGYLLSEKGRDEARRTALAEQNLGRLMTAPIRVLTPYQLLRAFFGLPGHEAILTDAAEGLFVLDELHAYDLSRLSLLLCAARHLAKEMGARFFVMSATLPGVLKAIWSELLGCEPVQLVASAETYRRFARHRLRFRGGDLISSVNVDEVTERVMHGEAVLVVATTVARAQQMYDLLRARVGDAAWLLHGRFTGEDRNDKEIALAKRVGTGLKRSDAGTVLVATQVVEVSLDVDFDALFSDPAPVEALLQRFGRVNRACRGGLREVIVQESIPDSSRYVYDSGQVTRALSVLRPHDGQPIAEDLVQEWVDEAYAPIAHVWTAHMRQAITSHEANLIQTNRPLNAHPELAARFDELFDGAEVVPASLAERYRALLNEAALDAATLRVPVSFGQKQQLSRRNQLHQEHLGRVPYDVADVPYDKERGLRLGIVDAQP